MKLPVSLSSGPQPSAPARSVNVALKIAHQPTLSVIDMVAAAQRVYATVGITLTTQVGVPGVRGYATVVADVGRCGRGPLSADQGQLLSDRAGLAPTDVLIYFVQVTDRPFNGCAAHPPSQPGAIIASIATVWTLAHEPGHVLGLRHVDDERSLMTGLGTGVLDPAGVPEITDGEVATLLRSPCVA